MGHRLDFLPDDVRESAVIIADAEGETLVGWKAITDHEPNGRAGILRYMIVTNKGYYEIEENGDVVRAAVLHQF